MGGLCDCGKPVYAKGMCHNCYNKKRYAENPGVRDKFRLYHTKYMETHPEYKQKCLKSQICKIIKQHHEAMKYDPEHLTTEFIKKLIKVDCKEV